MGTAIVIKSYQKDFEWLTYCLKSIQKYCHGFEEIVLLIPEGTEYTCTKEKVVHVEEKGDGYLWQMCVKLHADLYTSASHILFVDSDCVFTRKFSPEEMFKDGMPMLLRRLWSNSGDGVVWRHPASVALKWDVEYDTMASHPSIYCRHTLKSLRDYIERTHGQTLAEYVASAKTFIEFVTIGNYAIRFEPDNYCVIDCGENDGYPRPLIQHWSWGGLNDSIRMKLQEIVS